MIAFIASCLNDDPVTYAIAMGIVLTLVVGTIIYSEWKDGNL
jgi:hypothetical protein